MSRIRTIKPEFFSSEDIASMSPLARLFYVSMWCESDREGRFEWKLGTFKLRYFAADIVDLFELSKELIDRGLIVLYEVGGKKFAEIPTFKEHQVINNREGDSKIPARVEHPSVTRESGVKAEGKEGREGKGKERKEGVETARGSRLPENFEPDFQFAVDAGIQNTLEEAHKFRDYWNAQPGQKGVKLDWSATWRNWCRNAKQTRSTYLPPQPSQTVPSKPGIDPALAKIIKDQLTTKPPPDAIRAQLRQMAGGRA